MGGGESGDGVGGGVGGSGGEGLGEREMCTCVSARKIYVRPSVKTWLG